MEARAAPIEREAALFRVPAPDPGCVQNNMKILFLAHRIPFPPNKGDKIRSFNILQYLAARHEVHLACLIDDAADLQFVHPLESIARSVVFDRLNPRAGKLLALAGMLGSRSITVSYFHSSRLQKQVDEIIASRRIDAIFCSCSPMAEYVFRSRHARGALRAATRIMDLIDVDSLKWTQYAERSPAWKAWIYRYEARRLAEYEARIAREYQRVLLVSEDEKQRFPGAAGISNLLAVSNGVDLDFFSRAHAGAHAPATNALVFTGVMDYWPNVEGMQWFVESVLPLIRARVPEVKLFIVGNRPVPEVRRLGDVPGVTVTGFVEDVRDYLGPAALCIVPLRIARGVQNKVLEAMAMGKAVVSTPQALEGLRAEPGRDILVAENAEAFAAAVLRLLQAPDETARMGRNARACVETHYSWAENLRPLDDLLPAATVPRAAMLGVT